MELPATHLRLPASLPYPLTVQRIHAQVDSQIRKTQRLFTYSFLPTKPDEQGRRERQVREWDSPIQGQVVHWDVREGDIIREPRSVTCRRGRPGEGKRGCGSLLPRPVRDSAPHWSDRVLTASHPRAEPSSRYKNLARTMSSSTGSAQSAARTSRRASPSCERASRGRQEADPTAHTGPTTLASPILHELRSAWSTTLAA